MQGDVIVITAFHVTTTVILLRTRDNA